MGLFDSLKNFAADNLGNVLGGNFNLGSIGDLPAVIGEHFNADQLGENPTGRWRPFERRPT
ncbi:MAG: flagellar M-ring protein FliF [Bifidobacterium breve]|nr:flagellar M-ring protein FliF [Bifidobacterium breve]